MAISSNTLFHFFREFPFLMQAINDGLWPRYFVEKKWSAKDIAIPMFCFCDIPLSQIKDHIDEYGHYGIGVSKDFARDNNITPVTYLSQDSYLMDKLSYFISTFDTPSFNLKQMSVEELMLYYVKKVSGYNSDDELKRKFYDEREWRYIPQISRDVHLELLTGEYDEKEKVNEYSERTKACMIRLKPDNISYIIVNNECEVKEMIKVLKKRFESHRLLEQLYTRIITVKQIKEDF